MITALCIEKLVLYAKYGGVPGSTKEEYDSLRWEDERTKPTWQAIQNAWVLVQKDLENQIIQRDLNNTDVKMPRALEDHVDLLIDKGLVSIEDYPEEFQTVYNLKKELRSQLV